MPSQPPATSGNVGACLMRQLLSLYNILTHNCRRRNAWKLAGLHALCGLLFTAGYATREWGTYNYLYAVGETKKPLMIYIMSQVFVYICP